jgi:hypothetical protein
MPRAALFTLLVASVLNGSLHAQRAGAAFQGNVAAHPVRSVFAGQRGFRNGFFPGRGFVSSGFRGRGGFGSVFLPYFSPYDEPFEYDQSYAQAVTNEPAPRVVSRTAEASVPKAQVIEIPGPANSTAVKVLPTTVFILANGERLETRRFVLTATLLTASIERQRRTVPLYMLDLNATIAANRDRGIDLRIPADRNEISVSF